jgi:hypothetical protein
MTGILLNRTRVALQACAAGLLLSVIAAACCKQPPPPPLPAGCPRGVPPSTPAELEACRNISFDTDTLSGDEQPLLVMDAEGAPCPSDRSRKCRYGPLARIEPAVGAHRYSEKELKEGRIIARITLGPNEPEYKKYGLKAGETTYWWIQKDSTGTGGRSLYITSAKSERLPFVERKLEVHPYPYDRKEGRLEKALARWIWTLEDEKTEGSCGSASSCR